MRGTWLRAANGQMNVLVHYALQFVGVPYIYGGNNPISGMDCSGFVCELLRASGVLVGDHSSQMIYEYLVANGAQECRGPRCGAIVFFGKAIDKISHVGFCVNSDIMLEAGGGDHSVKHRSDAELKGAFIKMSPISKRHDQVSVLMPLYKLSLAGG